MGFAAMANHAEDSSKRDKGAVKVAHRDDYVRLTRATHWRVPDTFPTVKWDTVAINIYRVDMSKWGGRLHIPLHRPEQELPFTYPIKKESYVTCDFGPRRYYGLFHLGTDIKLLIGDTVVSVWPGRVRVVRYDRYGYGKFIVVSHPNGLETLYGHLSKVLVKPGQEIASGETLGLGGNTGRSTGSHLHFEFRLMGQQFDPGRVVDFETSALKVNEALVDSSWYRHIAEMRMVRYHVIRSGDTLGHIARRYGTTVTRLCQLNGISGKTILRVGRRLRVN